MYAVIVDFSHLFHLSRAAALRAGPAYDLTETTIENVVGKLRTVKRELARQGIRGYDLVFVEDRPATRKLALLPGYRAGRENRQEEKEQVKSYLLQNGAITRFCHSDEQEADDSIASLVKLALAQEDLQVIIISGDRDLWQLIEPRVRVYNPINRTGEKTQRGMVTEEDVEKAFKCRPIHIALHKALWGDAGDCVPNVMPRTQKQLLPIILKTDGRLETFRTLVYHTEDRYYLTEKCYADLRNREPEIERNYALVKLDEDCELVWE